MVTASLDFIKATKMTAALLYFQPSMWKKKKKRFCLKKDEWLT